MIINRIKIKLHELEESYDGSEDVGRSYFDLINKGNLDDVSIVKNLRDMNRVLYEESWKRYLVLPQDKREEEIDVMDKLFEEGEDLQENLNKIKGIK